MCQTKRQFAKAKRKLKDTLAALRLKMAPTKTRMGAIQKGFHFLGINFSWARTHEKTSNNKVNVSLHPRSVHRSIDKARQMQEVVGHPQKVQCYVYRWARWWGWQHRELKVRDNMWDWRQLKKRVDHT